MNAEIPWRTGPTIPKLFIVLYRQGSNVGIPVDVPVRLQGGPGRQYPSCTLYRTGVVVPPAVTGTAGQGGPGRQTVASVRALWCCSSLLSEEILLVKA